MIIHYLQLDPNFRQADFIQLKQQLPEYLSKKNDRLVHFMDRQRHLFGLLLLCRMWFDRFHRPLELQNLATTAYNRPYLEGSAVDFNISHAGDFVVCVLSPEKARVGIDIEVNRPVEFNEFTSTMNQDQWKVIKQSKDPCATFFNFWCIKESAIKADGRGLSLPLADITWDNQMITCWRTNWFIKPFKLDERHPGCLACNQEIHDLILKKIHWRALLS